MVTLWACLAVAVLLIVCVAAAKHCSSRRAPFRVERHAPFQGQSKCFSCEPALPAAADLYGNRCLDCEGPSFRYLSETIGAEQHSGFYAPTKV